MDAVRQAAHGTGFPRAVFWDTTTTALRALNLLRLDVALRERDRTGSATPSLPPGLLWRHRAVLTAGALTEPVGNHEAVNAAGAAAVDLLLHPEAPLTELRCRRLAGVFSRQFLSDGGHIERSPHYHVQILDVLTSLCQADRQRGGSCERHVVGIAARARTALNVMMTPGGRLARFGDISRTFSGETPDAQVQRLADREPAACKLEVLPEFGLVRCGWSVRGVTAGLCIDVGPMGLAGNPGHGHADMLSYVLDLGGRDIVVDPGTFLYSDSPEARWFKLPEAHATVRWEGQPCYGLRRFFRWSRAPSAPTLHVDRRASGGAVVTGTLHWESCHGWFTHRRRWYPRPEGLVVLDSVEAPTDATAVTRIPLAPGVRMTATRTGVMLDKGTVRVTVEARTGGASGARIVEGWYAAEYGTREEAPAVEWSISARRGVTHARTEIRMQ